MSAPQPAYSSRQRAVVVVLAGIVPLLIGVSGAVVIAVWRPRLPERIAIHWGGGAPDGFTGFWGVVAPLLGVTLLLAGVFLAAVLSLTDDAPPARGRLLVAISVGLTTALTIGIVASVGLQRDGAPVPDTMRVGQWLLVGTVIGGVLGTVVYLIAPKSVQADPRDYEESDPIELSSQERAVWTGVAAPSRHFVLLYGSVTVLAVGASLFAAIREPGAIATVFVAAVLVFSTTVMRWRVTVSREGFVARGAFGIPRFRIPLAEIESVRMARVDAFSQFGGWGLRWAPGRTGIILRSGDAVEVTRRNGRALVVTVADAAAGVALLNGFLARVKG